MVLRRLKTIEIVAKTEDPSNFICSLLAAALGLSKTVDQLWHAWDQYTVPDLAQTIAVKVLFCMCFGVIPLVASGTCLPRTKTLFCLLVGMAFASSWT
eukprot:1431220-Amphidinium_carterae.1